MGHVHEIIKPHSLCCWPQAPAATSVALAIAPIWRNGQPALRRLKPPLPDPATMVDAGWSSPVARQAHNLKVAGSNPAPATNAIKLHTPRSKEHTSALQSLIRITHAVSCLQKQKKK